MFTRLLKSLLLGSKRTSTVEEVRGLIAKGDLFAAKNAHSALSKSTVRNELFEDCLEAEIAFHEGDDARAEAVFRQVLAKAPSFSEAHYGWSLLLLEQGDTEAALEHALFAVICQPNEARLLAQVGLCHVTAGNFPAAERPLNHALRLNSEDKAAWNNLGIVYLAKGEPREAYACFERALKIDPHFSRAVENLLNLDEEFRSVGAERVSKGTSVNRGSDSVDGGEGTSPWVVHWDAVKELKRTGDFESAIEKAESIVLEWADMVQPACRLANLYESLGDSQAGLDVLLAFLERHPDSVDAMGSLGTIYLNLGQEKKAEYYLRMAVDGGLDDAGTLTSLAAALSNLGRYAEALELRRQASAKTNDYVYEVQLAFGLVSACCYGEAIDLFERLLSEDPMRISTFLVSYAAALGYVGRFEESLELFNSAISKAPQDATLRTQRAQLNLLFENFSQGWEDYSYRFQSATKHFRVLPYPKWRGEDLNGKTIIVLAEQGLGDQVMFSSCIPDLLALKPEKVIFEVIDRVAKTLARTFTDCEVVPTRQSRVLDWVKELGSIDFYVPLGDLPGKFRSRTADFPRLPYLLPDPLRVNYWEEILRQIGPAPYIGISWRGGSEGTRQSVRSMSLEAFSCVQAAVSGTYVCLQYGNVSSELQEASKSGQAVSYWPEAIENLDEFAALVQALSAIVTVCNTTVHYAGALGKPVYVVAPSVPEWRYGLKSEYLPWYKDVKVFRQLEAGDWKQPMVQIIEELKDNFVTQ